MAFRKPRPAAGDSLLPGYSELTEIGGGAFATVYRAVEAATGRPVALKILKVDTIHAHLIETFHHEIQALAKVSDHPNIVTLYRPATTSDGRPVLVLELCRGSLASRVRSEGPLDAQEVTRVGVKIAGALETAHRNGFLHRDMKPQNILVTNFAEPALADFGVAALQASAQATAGVFGFTTLHAAPEMLEGQHLSPATDVYGLASTMYQLITGQAPFATFDNEAPASVILRILRDPVRPLRSEHIPLALSDLLEAALSKQPEGRPRTALEFAQALQAVEEAAAWPTTDFLAWGEEGSPVRTGPVPAPGPGGAPSAAGESAHLYPTAPSVRVEAVEPRADRFSLPPLLPATPQPPTPPQPPVPAQPPPQPPTPAQPPAPAQPPVPAQPPAPAQPVTAATPPAPPPMRQGPAVATPEPAERQVVSPEQGRRGQASLPLERPPEPLAPLGPADDPAAAVSSGPEPPSRPSRLDPSDGAAPVPSSEPEYPTSGPVRPGPQAPSPPGTRPGSVLPAGTAHQATPGAGPTPERPVFVDPDPGPGGRPPRLPLAGDPVYEETMAVTRLFTAPAEADPEPAGPDQRVPGWMIAGLAVAIAVLVAAGLLLVGVL